jgi:MFS family permease
MYFISGFSSILFVTPIIALFLQQNGLSITQIMLLQSIFAFVVVVLEIPSGFLADMIGRKKTIVLSSVFAFLGILMYSFSYNFTQFAIAEILLAFGTSFFSGADSALLYDTLQKVKKEDQFKKVEGKAKYYVMIADTIGAALGGLIASFGLRYTFYCTVPFIFLRLIVSFTLVEPEREIKVHKKGHLYNMYKICRFALYKNKEVKWLIMYSGLLSATGIIGFWLYQPYMQKIGLPIGYFGLAFALFNLMAAFSSKYAHEIEEKIGRKTSLMLAGLALIVGFVLLGTTLFLFGFIFILFLQFTRGFAFPVIKDYINKVTWSDKRATVLSIASLIARVIFIIVSPFIGWAADVYSLQTGFLILAGIVFVFSLIILFAMKED